MFAHINMANNALIFFFPAELRLYSCPSHLPKSVVKQIFKSEQVKSLHRISHYLKKISNGKQHHF